MQFVWNDDQRTRETRGQTLTNLTSGSSPTGRAGAVETLGTVGRRSVVVRVTSAAVQAGRRGANVVQHLAVGAGESFGALAQVLVGRRVFALATVQTRLVRAAVIQVCRCKGDKAKWDFWF